MVQGRQYIPNPPPPPLSHLLRGTGLNRQGNVALTRMASSRRGLRTSPQSNPEDSKPRSAFSEFEVPRTYRNSTANGSTANAMGSFFGKIIGLREFSMLSVTGARSILGTSSGRLHTVREEMESHSSLASSLFALMPGASRGESRRESSNEDGSVGKSVRSRRDSWAAAQSSRRESPFMDRHSMDLPSTSVPNLQTVPQSPTLPNSPTATPSTEALLTTGSEKADDSHKIDIPGELNNSGTESLVKASGSKTPSRLSGSHHSQASEAAGVHHSQASEAAGVHHSQASEAAGVHHSQASEAAGVSHHHRGKRLPKTKTSPGEPGNASKEIPSARAVSTSGSRAATRTGSQFSETGGRKRRSSRISWSTYTLPNFNAEDEPLLRQSSLAKVGDDEEECSQQQPYGEIRARSMSSEAEVQLPSSVAAAAAAAAEEGDIRQEVGRGARRAGNQVSCSGIEIDDSGAAEAAEPVRRAALPEARGAAAVDPQDGRDINSVKAVKDERETISQQQPDSAMRAAAEVQSPSEVKGDIRQEVGEADGTDQHAASSSGRVEAIGDSGGHQRPPEVIVGDLRHDDFGRNRMRRRGSASDDSNSSDEHRLFPESPTAGQKKLPIERSRRTIQAEVLKYSMDEEVSRKFNIQRFDEEIQRLANFASPVEAWLNDLEQRIAKQSGTETSLMNLIDRSQTQYQVSTKDTGSPKRKASPSPPKRKASRLPSWEAGPREATEIAGSSLSPPSLNSPDDRSAARHRSKFNQRSRNVSNESLANRSWGRVQDAINESDDEIEYARLFSKSSARSR